MGRGGGVVAGSKHSKENEEHHSSGGGGGKADPKVTGIVCLFFAFVFLILAIVVPIVMVADPAGDSCTVADTLNRNDQAICIPDDYSQTWVAEYEAKGKDYAKVYKFQNATVNYTTSSYAWYNYYARLKGTYDYFSFSVPFYVTGKLAVYCDGKKCDHLRMYLLNSAQFAASVDENGEFHEKTFKYDFKNFSDETVNWFDYWATGPDVWYLVFSNNKNKKVDLVYSILMVNKVVDTTGMEPAKCEDNKCTFKDMKEGEFLVMNHESPTNASYYGAADNDPEYFDIKMHNLRISWGGVVAVIIIFVLLVIVCAVGGLYFLILKK